MPARYYIIILIISLIVFSNNIVFANDRMEELVSDIEMITSNKKCTSNNDCKFIGFGSLPCGGYDKYLIYSSANVNEDILKKKAEEYYKLDKEHEIKMSIDSICMMIPEPKPICVDSVCIDGRNNN